MNIQGIHHAAYRCKNAKQTVEFYQQVLAMDFQLAIAEDRVPSTGETNSYMHAFRHCHPIMMILNSASDPLYADSNHYNSVSPNTVAPVDS